MEYLHILHTTTSSLRVKFRLVTRGTWVTKNSGVQQRGYTRTNRVTTWRVVAGSSRTVRGVGGRREARLTKDLSRNQHTEESQDPRRRSIRVGYVCGVRRDASGRRRLSPHDVFRAIGEGEARARTERTEHERGRIVSADHVTVAARRVAATRTRTGPTFTRVLSMFRCSFGQLAPLVEAESENSSEYSHVIKMDTLTRRSCCAGAPRDRNRGSQHRLHGCSRRSRPRPQRHYRRHLAAPRDVAFELARFVHTKSVLF